MIWKDVHVFCAVFSFNWIFGYSNMLSEVIADQVEKHYQPVTLRVIASKRQHQDLDWHLLSPYPLLSMKLSKGKRLSLHHTFYTSIVIVWLDSLRPNDNEYKKMLVSAEETINRRWDRLIVIGKDLELKVFMGNGIIEKLKEKIGISIDEKDIWVDPLVYNGGKMEKLKSVREMIAVSAMGANLRGRHFKVSGCEFPPWSYKVGESASGEIILEGNFVSMLNAAAGKFNFTYESAYTGWEYGTLHENGTWTGMLSNVLYEERGYEFTFWLGHDINYPDFDYPSYLVEAEIFYVTGQPKTEIPWNAFLLPFSITVWLLVLVSFAVLGAVQAFATYLKHGRKWVVDVWVNATFQPLTLALEQGLQDIPKGIRYFSVVWLLTCTILATGYRSTLRTNLMFPTSEIIPLTVQELGQRSDYLVTLYVMGQLELSIMRNSEEPHIKDIRPRLSFEFGAAEKCLEKALLNYHTACVAWSPFLEQEIARTMTLSSQMEPLVRSKNNYKRISNSMAFQKYSIYVDAFFGITGAASDSGLMQRWQDVANYKFKKIGIQRVKSNSQSRVYQTLAALMSKDDSDRKPLTIVNLKVVFALLAIGFFFCFLMFAFECVYFIVRERKLIRHIGIKLKAQHKQLLSKSTARPHTHHFQVQHLNTEKGISDLEAIHSANLP